jgi:heavy metal translocating P-type ATPase
MLPTYGAAKPQRFSRETTVTLLTLLAIALHLVLRFFTGAPRWEVEFPLYLVLLLGGLPLVVQLARKALAREFGSDLLAGISITAAVLLGEYLVASIVVLMLSGGAALERAAARRASSVLDALARRMPTMAHQKTTVGMEEISVSDIQVNDTLVVLPHELCPVDGVVIDGHGVMDESYLTGEPFQISKTPGSLVLSGAVNGETALTIRAQKLAIDSRYSKIMQVMHESVQRQPRIRRLGDQLGAWYTPLALGLAVGAWLLSGDPVRFLAVLVVATPCPLLIGIPVAIVGAISLSARRSIVIRNPGILEQVSTCRTLIFDKTGTLTYGRPQLTEIVPAPGFTQRDALLYAASLEQYSKHPLSAAILDAARKDGLALEWADNVREVPGQGLEGTVAGRTVHITGRAAVAGRNFDLPPEHSGLECVILADGAYAATFHFRDQPREDSKPFISHLRPRHGVSKVMLLSGDREAEVRYLADSVGISEIYASKSPEEKVGIVSRETDLARTLFVGDGINDAPALAVATVGVAFGPNSEVTSEAADAVVMSGSLSRIDELMHISARMRRIALQSALGGMALSIIGMIAASAGHLAPLEGAIAQEVIDLLAVLNAVRTAALPKSLTDFE